MGKEKSNKNIILISIIVILVIAVAFIFFDKSLKLNPPSEDGSGEPSGGDDDCEDPLVSCGEDCIDPATQVCCGETAHTIQTAGACCGNAYFNDTPMGTPQDVYCCGGAENGQVCTYEDQCLDNGVQGICIDQTPSLF